MHALDLKCTLAVCIRHMCTAEGYGIVSRGAIYFAHDVALLKDETPHKSGIEHLQLRNIFEEATACAPSIIFIDEIDALCPKRDDVCGPPHGNVCVLAVFVVALNVWYHSRATSWRRGWLRRY